MKLTTILISILFSTPLSNGAKILAIFPFEMKSHRGVLEPMVEELAKNGRHEVDVISTFTPSAKNTSNYKNILILPTSKEPPKIVFATDYEPTNDFPWLQEVNNKVCDLLGHPLITELVKSSSHRYDLLIVHVS